MKNLATKTKLLLLVSASLIAIAIIGIFSIKGLSQIDESINKISKDRVPKVILVNNITDQVNLIARAIRNAAMVPSEAQKELERVKEARVKLTSYFDQLQSSIKSEKGQKIILDTLEARKQYVIAIDKVAIMIEQKKSIEELSDFIVKSEGRKAQAAYLEKLDSLKNFQNDLINEASKEADETYHTIRNIVILISVIGVIFMLIFSIFINNIIASSINSIQQGLQSFFSFLNRETTKADLIKLDSKDEFGVMAQAINENIEKTRKGIEEDRKLIDETIAVLGEFEQGDLCQRLELNVANPALMQLKSVLNNMASNLENNIDNVLKVLEEYSHYNYLNKVDEKGLKEHLLKLATGVNTLGNAVTTMLTSSLTNGVDLQNDASTLKQAVESLSTASNQQAASLEETAAAMEEMTSNVQNNVAKSNEMATMAKETDGAAREGAILASRTASAMTEIQSATASINDAVAIIENIAFQTNILSLNAAVEAATAGDAGKGFAVVAQEVRNLANRSAEAAKEIKEMASQAANKSNEGMNIATELTRGFEVIASKIAQTASMVQDVSNANREQMQGIGQINTAVTQLDQMTQENAKVAAQADAIANATISKAEAMVEEAQAKEFVGKNNIRSSQTTQRSSKTAQAARPVVVSKNSYSSKKALPKNGAKTESDVWESF